MPGIGVGVPGLQLDARLSDAYVDLADGRLVEVLRPHRPPAMPIHAVMPAHRMAPPRVRVLLEALEQAATGAESGAAGGVDR
jgi:DNA-binding transcriptional LysR family regulator